MPSLADRAAPKHRKLIASSGILSAVLLGLVITSPCSADPGYSAGANQGTDTAANALLQKAQDAFLAKDYGEAMRWYRKAADQGYPVAQVAVANLYFTGRGVARDYAEGVRWLRKGADQGYSVAQGAIGYAYEHGLTITQDYAEAARWYRKAADQGDPDAQFNIATLYIAGNGVPQDLDQARSWMQKAAASGNNEAKKWIAAH